MSYNIKIVNMQLADVLKRRYLCGADMEQKSLSQCQTAADKRKTKEHGNIADIKPMVCCKMGR